MQNLGPTLWRRHLPGVFLIYRRVIRLLSSIEKRQVTPAVARVNAILDDVKGVTATVRQEASRIDRLIDWLVDGAGRRRGRGHEEPATTVM